MIPTGSIPDLTDLPINFRTSRAIGCRVFLQGYHMEHTEGYDHNYIINKSDKECGFAAELYEPEFGRILTVHTTQPCMQLYTGNFIPENLKGKNGIMLDKYSGLCLETQGYPDATHHRQFESTIISPGESCRETTEYRFRIRRNK